MGVHGLWDIVGVTARPVRIEALRNKKLAVDASIWIYQFLKAVRDSDGNQLKNSHIIGFFRRICKLLYFGIKPIFVFDGGVPALKRNTIRKRKDKREGNKESIEQTAQRILSKQLQQYAEGKLSGSSPSKRPRNTTKSTAVITEKPTSELYEVYYDDIVDRDGESEDERVQDEKRKLENESKLFRGQDDYDLPTLKEIKVAHDDNRLTTDYEYDRLTKDIQDDLDDVDLDKLDPQSKEFERLPLSTQYIALSHLRLRSRLRMGYTKTQLQSLFPDPMEFSKFQIKMVQKRNFFTQKIMNVTGMDGDDKEEMISRRIASDRNRAYNLKRTSDGFALSISKDDAAGSNPEKPIMLHDIIPSMVPNAHEILEIESDEDADIDWAEVETVKPKKNNETKSSNKVENTLFIRDSDEEKDDESDEESVDMEDVTEALPQKSVINAEDEDDDETMRQIKYLYEYSNKNNKKGSAEQQAKVIRDEDDMDEYHKIQLKHFEDEELKMAIAQSKKDYIQMLDDEKTGAPATDNLTRDQPIILSASTLSKTLKLPNFSMKNNLLFGGSKATKTEVSKLDENEDKLVDHKTGVNNEEDTSKKPLPMPTWFSSYVSKPQTPIVDKETQPRMTEDERAGIVSYGDVDNYFSSDDDVEFTDVTSAAPEVVHIDDDDNDVEFTDMAASGEAVVHIDDDDNDDDDRITNINNPQVIDDDDRDNVSDIEVVDEDIVAAPREEPKVPVVRQESGNITETMIPTSVAEQANADILNNELEETDTNKPMEIGDILTGDSTEKAEQDEQEYVFSDEEEVNLMLGMEEENKAYESFVTNINGTSSKKKSWGFEVEAKLQDQLRKQKRDSDEVSTNMIHDVQDLLGRFGIPFITAPMEAEAQCAELKLLELVDGIITDDSDCFLFGGDRIYKNLFSDKHFVECYNIDDVNEELGLSRDKMIELAVLLGSDYTDGIKGVGKVTAMEIMSEFNSLEKFRDWWLSYQQGKIDEKTDTPLRKKLRKKLSKNLFLSQDFPNKLIYEAYLHPEVDHDKSPFKWGYPSLDKLRTYLQYNAGWDKEKVDETLLPVIKNMNKPQTTIEEFFPLEMIQRRRKLDMSKRIKDATDKLKSKNKNTKKQRTV